MRKLSLASAFIVLSFVGVAGISSAAASTSTPDLNAACADVETVFAHGSGQKVGDTAPKDKGGLDAEFQEFNTDLKARIVAPLTLHTYELGKDRIDGWQYPAISIDGGWGWWTKLSGFVSSGGGFEYGASVNDGTEELNSYLRQRIAKCPSSSFILGGYSQGAQVVGETYVEKLDDALRSHIVYNVMFGDPKNYLPEGKAVYSRGNPTAEPAACTGTRSEWRMNVPDCWTASGSLGARNPYLPASWTTNTGVWCQKADLVCGSGDASLSNSDGHNHYVDGGQISQAVEAVLVRLAPRIPTEKAAGLIARPKTGPTLQDTVFLIDSTGSMGGTIEQVKQFAAEQADLMTARGGKVAIVEYRDSHDSFTARVLTDLTTDPAVIKAQLATINAGGGGDIPEGLLHGLWTAFNGISWEHGATKAAVILTDADFHDPDLTTEADGKNVTLQDVVNLSLAIDPINIYPIVPDYEAWSYQQLADQTAGKVIVNSGDAAAALATAMTNIVDRPTVTLPLDAYETAVGGTLTFDASSAVATSGTIVGYDWDVNGDGTFETSTTSPILAQVYDAEFDGQMQVRVTDSNGGVGSASAPVHIGAPTHVATLPTPPTALTSAVVSTTGDTSSVDLNWDAAETVGTWGIEVNGVPLGAVTGDTRTLTVTDVERGADVELGVFGVDAAGRRGNAVTTTVAAFVPVAVPTATPTATPEPAVTPVDPGPTPTPVPTVTAVNSAPAKPVIVKAAVSGRGPSNTKSAATPVVPLTPSTPGPLATISATPTPKPTAKPTANPRPTPTASAASPITAEPASNTVGWWVAGAGALLLAGLGVGGTLFMRRGRRG